MISEAGHPVDATQKLNRGTHWMPRSPFISRIAKGVVRGPAPYPAFTLAMSPPAQASTLGFITLNQSGGMAASRKLPG